MSPTMEGLGHHVGMAVVECSGPAETSKVQLDRLEQNGGEDLVEGPAHLPERKYRILLTGIVSNEDFEYVLEELQRKLVHGRSRTRAVCSWGIVGLE